MTFTDIYVVTISNATGTSYLFSLLFLENNLKTIFDPEILVSSEER